MKLALATACAVLWHWTVLVDVPAWVTPSRLRSTVTTAGTACQVPLQFVKAAGNAGFAHLTPVSAQGCNGATYFATRSSDNEPAVVKFVEDVGSRRNSYNREITYIKLAIGNSRAKSCMPDIFRMDIDVPGHGFKGYAMARGSPLPYLHDHASGTEQQRVAIMRRLFECTEAMHEAGIAHRDISGQISENVVMIKGLPVLIDFGMANKINEQRRGVDYWELTNLFRKALCPHVQGELDGTSPCAQFCDRVDAMRGNKDWNGLKLITDRVKGDAYLRNTQ
jgi:serine/threonine protein kinase